MSTDLKAKIRKLNDVLKIAATQAMDFNDLTDKLSEILGFNVYISGVDGTILAYSTSERFQCEIDYGDMRNIRFPDYFTEKLLSYSDTVENEYEENPKCTFGDQGPCIYKHRYLTFVPIYGIGERIGTLFFSKYGNGFDEDNIVLCEYSSAIVVMEMLRYIQEQKKKKEEAARAAKVAISTLSYSEIKALKMMLAEVDSEGVIVASRISKKGKITNSVISNSLKKVESAGAIESKGLGVKGTYIKVLNPEIKNELDRFEIMS